MFAASSLIRRRIYEKTAFHILLIAAVAIAVYSNTLNSPFQWDEILTIEGNPVIKDFSYFMNPSKAKALEGTHYFSLRDRYFGYLSFALNYRFHGLDVKGYHMVNIALHILNSIIIYLLAKTFFKTPFLISSPLSSNSGRIALLSSLLFASHPVQTEAVTYIMGRLQLLMSFFYLASIMLYMKWRLMPPLISTSPEDGERMPSPSCSVSLYLFSLLCVSFAMKTKENAFTIPFMILLIEFFFFDGKKGKRLLYLFPFMLTLLIIPLARMNFGGSLADNIGMSTRHYLAVIPRMEYFYTQLSVVVSYIRLLFLPVNQNFDYGFFLYKTFFSTRIVLSFLFLCSIAGAGLYLFFRSYRKNKPFRILSMGIFWFFIALSVESSFLPINMIMCEYRLYLPSFGAFFAASTALFIVYEKASSATAKRTIICISLLVPIILASASYARNEVWRTKISLWGDVVKKAPQNARGHYNLGNAYEKEGRIAEAIGQYKETVRLMPEHYKAHNNLGIALGNSGKTEEAVEHFITAIRIKPDNEFARLNLAMLFIKQGRPDMAEVELFEALRINPENSAALRILEQIKKKQKEETAGQDF